MAVFKCKMCGGALEPLDGINICECEYCGTQQTLSKSRDDITANLFNRANHLRLNNDFDKAQEVYENIVQSCPDNSEAYWGIVLCKYGIEYVDDVLTGKKIPTCHRTQLESITSDVDYQSAIDFADYTSRSFYENEAEQINKIQHDILNIVRSEEPFDVFICYKETDGSGNRTLDSVIANEIYYQLEQEGFKTFYAAITLEDKLGQEYEPYIFSALQSAKVMLVVGTKPEYFNSPWVKNEWNRYLKFIKSDRSRRLIPCYKDMDAYDLPEEFAHLQAQDMSKIGFMTDIIRGIKKIVSVGSSFSESAYQRPLQNVDTLLQRIEIFLNDADFENAEEYCERVLDIDPDCSQAYFSRFLAENNCHSASELYLPEKIKRFSEIYINAYGFRMESDEIYRKRMQYVMGNSMKNAAAFSQGAEKTEIMHIAEGIISLVRNNIKEKEQQALQNEQNIADEFLKKHNVEKINTRNKKRIKVIIMVSSIIFLINFFGTLFFRSSSPPVFLFLIIVILCIALIKKN